METETPTTPTPAPPRTARSAPILLVLLVAALLVAVWLPGRVAEPPSPGVDGTLEIVMDGYRFVPDTVALPTGTPVTLVLVNRDDTSHHVAIGRNVIVEDGAEVGFGEDLFAGLAPLVDPPRARAGPSAQHPTFTVLVSTGETVRVTFTLPTDRDGTWQMGCFTARGCHFRAGLAGTVVVG